ncbi:MAG: HlyC/CorC family transporter [Rubellimicrobium sp.]|nr:HlyC/CorC family transporter [Rubellimicrobium sp.]
MSHPPDAPAPGGAAPREAEDSAEPDPSEGSGRGLFTRLREVFAAPDPAAGSAVPPAARDPSLVNLRRLRVGDVAIPTAEIVAVPVTIGLDALVEAFRASGLTRIPVYEGNLDHPLGLVNLKDLALRYGFAGTGGAGFDLRAILRPLLFVPPSMRAGVLLHKMQAERTHMALVIDEYGGTDGLVTIEDLVETVVGAIDDEHDEAEDAPIRRDRDGSWLIDAGAELEDLCRAIGHALTAHEAVDAEDVDTVGGLVFLLAGHVPVRGEVVAHPEGYTFEVIEADRRRVRRLRLRPPPDRSPTDA